LKETTAFIFKVKQIVGGLKIEFLILYIFIFEFYQQNVVIKMLESWG